MIVWNDHVPDGTPLPTSPAHTPLIVFLYHACVDDRVMVIDRLATGGAADN